MYLYLHMFAAAALPAAAGAVFGRVTAGTYVNNLQNAFVWR